MAGKDRNGLRKTVQRSRVDERYMNTIGTSITVLAGSKRS